MFIWKTHKQKLEWRIKKLGDALKNSLHLKFSYSYYYENHSYQKFWILLKDIFKPETRESIPFYNNLKWKTWAVCCLRGGLVVDWRGRDTLSQYPFAEGGRALCQLIFILFTFGLTPFQTIYTLLLQIKVFLPQKNGVWQISNLFTFSFL